MVDLHASCKTGCDPPRLDNSMDQRKAPETDAAAPPVELEVPSSGNGAMEADDTNARFPQLMQKTTEQ